MRTFLLSLSLLSGGGLGLAQAQTAIHFGPRLGGNYSSATFNNLEKLAGAGANVSSSRSSLAGVQVGVAASIGSGPWLVQPALVFSQKGVKQTATTTATFGTETITENATVVSRVNFLELPVNVVYAFGADGQGLQVFAGPYLAVGVGGKAEYTEKLTSTNPNSLFNLEVSGAQTFAFGNTFAERDPNGTSQQQQYDARARRFDAGVGAGVGYRAGPFQVQLGYAFGLLNAQPDYPASFKLPNDTGYHRNAQLTATYFVSAGGR